MTDRKTMSQDHSPYDAYQPPPLAEEVIPVQGGISGWLKAICVIAIILGALGLLSALMGIVGLVFGEQIQGAFAPGAQPGVPQEMVDAQKQMQAELQAVQDRFWMANAALTSVHILIASMLLVGGIQCLRRASSGRRVLFAGCCAAIVFEIARGIVQAFVQMETASVTTRSMQRMMEATGAQAPPEATEFVMIFTKVGIVIGAAVFLALIIAKLVFYVLSIRYLSKPTVRTYLDSCPQRDEPKATSFPQ